ncbi:MAG: hypothetical protein ACT4OK_06565 [Gemmobacter sp.]
MFSRIFRSKEVRWTQAALEEMLDRNPNLQHYEIRKRANQRIDAKWCIEGFKRGLSAAQIAAVAVLQSAEEAVIFGDGNFYYRGQLTMKGRELVAAHRLAAQFLLESGVFDQSKFDQVRTSLERDIAGMG